MIALTMAAEDASWSISETKDWSIFKMSTSVCWSCDSDECPVPKSSMDSFTPSSRRRPRLRFVAPVPLSRVVSVISRVS